MKRGLRTGASRRGEREEVVVCWVEGNCLAHRRVELEVPKTAVAVSNIIKN